MAITDEIQGRYHQFFISAYYQNKPVPDGACKWPDYPTVHLTAEEYAPTNRRAVKNEYWWWSLNFNTRTPWDKFMAYRDGLGIALYMAYLDGQPDEGLANYYLLAAIEIIDRLADNWLDSHPWEASRFMPMEDMFYVKLT